MLSEALAVMSQRDLLFTGLHDAQHRLGHLVR